MDGEGAGSLREVLAARREGIVREWLARALQAYPGHTARFLGLERDRFRNPVGHSFKEALPALFDQLLGGMDMAEVARHLDALVKIRAVQDFTAGQAVAFLFALKQVLRAALRGEGGREVGEELAVLEGRIDEMAILAFDLFMRCRERLYEIRAAEVKRRTYLLQRMHGICRPPALTPPLRRGEAG